MFKNRKFWCPCNQYNLWDNREKHQNKHLFDQYSFTHISGGFFQYILFKKYGFLFNLILHIVFEIFENASTGIKFFRNEYDTYKGDTIANIIGDLFMFAVGYYTISKIKINNILLFITFEMLLYFVYNDNFFLVFYKSFLNFLYSKKV